VATVVKTVSGTIQVGGEGSTVSESRGFPVVVSTTGGVLYCRSDNKAWCKHIEAVVITGADADSLRIDLSLMMVNEIKVPLVPTLRVYANIQIDGTKKSGVLGCWLVEPVDEPSKDTESLFLGLLAPGEGRKQMRDMALQVLLPDVGMAVNTACRSLRHNLMRNVALVEQCGRDKRVNIANAWTMKWYEKCLLCLGEEGPGSVFSPDLIPER